MKYVRGDRRAYISISTVTIAIVEIARTLLGFCCGEAARCGRSRTTRREAGGACRLLLNKDFSRTTTICPAPTIKSYVHLLHVFILHTGSVVKSILSTKELIKPKLRSLGWALTLILVQCVLWAALWGTIHTGYCM